MTRGEIECVCVEERISFLYRQLQYIQFHSLFSFGKSIIFRKSDSISVVTSF